MTGWMLTVMLRYPKICTEFKSNKEASSANSARKCIYTQTPVKKKKKKNLLTLVLSVMTLNRASESSCLSATPPIETVTMNQQKKKKERNLHSPKLVYFLSF